MQCNHARSMANQTLDTSFVSAALKPSAALLVLDMRLASRCIQVDIVHNTCTLPRSKAQSGTLLRIYRKSYANFSRDACELLEGTRLCRIPRKMSPRERPMRATNSQATASPPFLRTFCSRGARKSRASMIELAACLQPLRLLSSCMRPTQ